MKKHGSASHGGAAGYKERVKHLNKPQVTIHLERVSPCVCFVCLKVCVCVLSSKVSVLSRFRSSNYCGCYRFQMLRRNTPGLTMTPMSATLACATLWLDIYITSTSNMVSRHGVNKSLTRFLVLSLSCLVSSLCLVSLPCPLSRLSVCLSVFLVSSPQHKCPGELEKMNEE